MDADRSPWRGCCENSVDGRSIVAQLICSLLESDFSAVQYLSSRMRGGIFSQKPGVGFMALIHRGLRGLCACAREYS